MTRIKVNGFKIFRGRHNNGKQYCYHRKTGERIDLEKHPIGSVGFFAECARINALLTTVSPKPGTLGLLIAAYRGDAVFADLAPRTRTSSGISRPGRTTSVSSTTSSRLATRR